MKTIAKSRIGTTQQSKDTSKLSPDSMSARLLNAGVKIKTLDNQVDGKKIVILYYGNKSMVRPDHVQTMPSLAWKYLGVKI